MTPEIAREAQQFRDALESQRPITFKTANKDDYLECTAIVQSIREIRDGSRVSWRITLTDASHRPDPDHQAPAFEAPVKPPVTNIRKLFVVIITAIGLVMVAAAIARWIGSQ